MNRRFVQRRFSAWIAVMAILLAALAPSISAGLAKASGDAWVEICTTEGARWIQAGSDGPERAPASAHLLDHCPYCSVHAPTLGLPPALSGYEAPGQRCDALPRAFLAAPHTLHAWVRAQPRAPPRFS